MTTFLALLERANTVAIHSASGVNWTLDKVSGNPNNELVQFHWEDQEGHYSVALTEGAIAAGKWIGSSFFCTDVEGEEAQISFYEHTPLLPGTHLVEGLQKLKCAASIEGGLLTLENGCTVDLEKLVTSLDFIANAAIPSSNDAEHDLLVDAQASAGRALSELTRIYG